VVIVSALLSAIHVLTLALGLGAVFIRGQAMAGPLDQAGWRRLLAADSAWGAAALLWITSGLARVFWGGKEPAFYWGNGFFWLKMTLFVAVVLIESKPALEFGRARRELRRGAALPLVPIETLRRINKIEVVLVVLIPFIAASMARGLWLF
jgi:putative membrane protein